MKILLVDDHVLFREGIVLLLPTVMPDAEPVEAGTCEEAFRLLSADRSIELVLMDLSLPGISGIDGIVELRARYPEIPVVALSSSDDGETVMQALEAGAMGFIPKSSTSAILGAALRLVMSKGIYLPPSAFLGGRFVSSPSPAAKATSPERGERTSPSDLGLTPRQADVLYLILQGKPAKSICRELELSASTVKVHTSAVLRALHSTTRAQAVVAAAKLKLQFNQR